MKNHRLKRRPLSHSNIFYQNFMKLNHIAKYHNVFFKFDNWLISHQALSSYGPLFMKIHHLKRSPPFKSNIFYQNFMKLGHIVKYHDVFFKFQNGLYHIVPAGVIALC